VTALRLADLLRDRRRASLTLFGSVNGEFATRSGPTPREQFSSGSRIHMRSSGAVRPVHGLERLVDGTGLLRNCPTRRPAPGIGDRPGPTQSGCSCASDSEHHYLVGLA
jgi:hypothetical protein